MAIAHDMRGQLRAVVLAQGMSGRFFRANVPGDAGVPVRFLLRHPGLRDEAIVNAYGVDAHILTFPAEMFATPPQKFDVVQYADGTRYVLDAVLPRMLADTVVGWTGYARGKGL